MIKCKSPQHEEDQHGKIKTNKQGEFTCLHCEESYKTNTMTHETIYNCDYCKDRIDKEDRSYGMEYDLEKQPTNTYGYPRIERLDLHISCKEEVIELIAKHNT